MTKLTKTQIALNNVTSQLRDGTAQLVLYRDAMGHSAMHLVTSTSQDKLDWRVDASLDYSLLQCIYRDSHKQVWTTK